MSPAPLIIPQAITSEIQHHITTCGTLMEETYPIMRACGRLKRPSHCASVEKNSCPGPLPPLPCGGCGGLQQVESRWTHYECVSERHQVRSIPSICEQAPSAMHAFTMRCRACTADQVLRAMSFTLLDCAHPEEGGWDWRGGRGGRGDRGGGGIGPYAPAGGMLPTLLGVCVAGGAMLMAPGGVSAV